MTTWYFDSVNGLDTNSGLTDISPKQYYDNFNVSSASPGDTFLFKRGTQQVITVIYKPLKSGLVNQYSYYGVYGTGVTNYVTFSNPSGIGNLILNGANIKYITFEDLRFDATACNVSINCSSQGLTDSTHHVIFRRCHFYNSDYSGIYASRESTSPNGMHHYLFEDCEAYNNGAHGLSLTGEWSTILRGKFYNNCATSEWGGHGISTLWQRTEVTTGWTNVPATNIWYRTLGVAELDVKYLSCNVPSAFYRYLKNTRTPEQPGLYEFGVSTGQLFINSGTDPNLTSTNYAWGRCGNNKILYAESYLNRYNAATPWHEGHGIAFDDFTEDSLMLGCYSHDNEGSAFTINRGDRNMIVGCVSENNWNATLGINTGQNNKIYHVTARNNNIGIGAGTSEIYSGAKVIGTVIKNCILEGVTSKGIDIVDPAGAVVSNINARGYATPVSTNINASNITSFDPMLNTNFVPQNADVRIGGEFISPGLTDFKGRKFKFNSSLGAIEASPSIMFKKVVI